MVDNDKIIEKIEKRIWYYNNQIQADRKKWKPETWASAYEESCNEHIKELQWILRELR
jgi:hypothetical protein